MGILLLPSLLILVGVNKIQDQKAIILTSRKHLFHFLDDRLPSLGNYGQYIGVF